MIIEMRRRFPVISSLTSVLGLLVGVVAQPIPAWAADATPAPGETSGQAAASPAKSSSCKAALMLKLPVVMEGLRASVPVAVNGKDMRFWLDSGAFFSFMPEAKAQELGLKLQNLPFGFQMSGIGGSTTPSLATVKSFGLVGQTLKDVQFVVGGSDIGNAMLGLNLLALGDTEYDLANGVVNLFQVKGCSQFSLAYWAGTKPVNVVKHLPGTDAHDKHIYAEVTVNGKKLRASFDTGAPTTSLSRRGAELAGILVSDSKAVPSYSMTGIGRGSRASWIVKIADFGIGDEHIQNTPMRIIDERIDSFDVLLGADFFLAHHIFVSRSQNRIYMTYNGGPIFSISTDGEVAKQNTVERNLGGDEKTAAPTTADGFAGRGSGRLARGDTPGALADFDEAIRMAPDRADLLATRSRMLLQSGKGDEGLKDLDHAIRLSPQDHDLLATRAWVRLNRDDRVGALADIDAASALVPKGSFDAVSLAILYERLGRADKALVLINPVLDMHKEDSKYPQLLNNRCWLRGLANVELAAGLEDCNKAIRKLGAHPGLLDSRALIQLRLGDTAAAIADADAALAVKQMPSTLYFRALAHKARGETEAAAADMAAAVKLEANVVKRFAPFGIWTESK
ncbi:aspartyl protease family protein [Novosphingobium sp.]|uniref:aspartyl protease family protein n=1 Tax=Novosphingobium sp. TaxID=1874826 RepID=UPI0038BB5216